MDEWEIDEIWNNSEIIRLTPYTITDRNDFKAELEEIRKRGYALDNEENETGVRCIACSLKEPMGSARHAFSISAPVSRMDNDRIRELAASVLQVRGEIAEKLRA